MVMLLLYSIKQMSGSSQAVLKMSGSLLAVIKELSGSHQTDIRPSVGRHQIVKNLQDLSFSVQPIGLKYF